MQSHLLDDLAEACLDVLVAADDQADDRLVEQVLEGDLAQRQPERARSEHAGRVEHALRVFDGIDRARQECHESVEDGARIERDGIDDGLGLDHGKHGAVAADRPAVEPECTGNGGGCRNRATGREHDIDAGIDCPADCIDDPLAHGPEVGDEGVVDIEGEQFGERAAFEELR